MTGLPPQTPTLSSWEIELYASNNPGTQPDYIPLIFGHISRHEFSEANSLFFRVPKSFKKLQSYTIVESALTLLAKFDYGKFISSVSSYPWSKSDLPFVRQALFSIENHQIKFVSSFYISVSLDDFAQLIGQNDQYSRSLANKLKWPIKKIDDTLYVFPKKIESPAKRVDPKTILETASSLII